MNIYEEIKTNMKESEDFSNWNVRDFIADGRYTYAEKIRYIANELEESGNVDSYDNEQWNKVLLDISKELNNSANNIEKIESTYKGNMKESEEPIDENDIINPEDKDYADGHLMKVCLWSGAGYSLSEFYVYVRGDNAENALEKVVVYCEENGYTGFILDVNEVEAMAERDYAEELAEYGGDLDEFITNYLNFVYVDATMEGAKQPYYVYGENLRIENV